MWKKNGKWRYWIRIINETQIIGHGKTISFKDLRNLKEKSKNAACKIIFQIEENEKSKWFFF